MPNQAMALMTYVVFVAVLIDEPEVCSQPGRESVACAGTGMLSPPARTASVSRHALTFARTLFAPMSTPGMAKAEPTGTPTSVFLRFRLFDETTRRHRRQIIVETRCARYQPPE